MKTALVLFHYPLLKIHPDHSNHQLTFAISKWSNPPFSLCHLSCQMQKLVISYLLNKLSCKDDSAKTSSLRMRLISRGNPQLFHPVSSTHTETPLGLYTKSQLGEGSPYGVSHPSKYLQGRRGLQSP